MCEIIVDETKDSESNLNNHKGPSKQESIIESFKDKTSERDNKSMDRINNKISYDFNQKKEFDYSTSKIL